MAPSRREKIRTGIIGGGFSGFIHIESVRRLGYVEVVALADLDEERAKLKAKALSVAKAYGDYRDLIDDQEVQVVHINTPNYLHFPQAKAALEAGKHVICDKPLAMNSQESRILVEIAKQKSVVNALTFNYRFYPLVQQSKALIDKRALGPLYLVQGGGYQDWLLYDTDYNWRVEAGKGGRTRAVGDIGTHWMDMIQFITGLKIEWVLAELITFLPVRKKYRESLDTFADRHLKPTEYQEVTVDTEDCGIVLLKFADSSTRGVMTVSQVSAGRKCRQFYEIFGAKSSIAWDSEIPNQLWIGYRNKPNQLLIKDPFLMDSSVKKYASYPGGHTEGFPDTHTQCQRAIYQYIREEKYKKHIPPDFPTFWDGHREQLLCEAILKSNKTKSWVKVAA